jgi:hypothetical protein
MDSPVALLRFVQADARKVVLSWERFFTAPFRALSPVGLLTAIGASKRNIVPGDPFHERFQVSRGCTLRLKEVDLYSPSCQRKVGIPSADEESLQDSFYTG